MKVYFTFIAIVLAPLLVSAQVYAQGNSSGFGSAGSSRTTDLSPYTQRRPQAYTSFDNPYAPGGIYDPYRASRSVGNATNSAASNGSANTASQPTSQFSFNQSGKFAPPRSASPGSLRQGGSPGDSDDDSGSRPLQINCKTNCTYASGMNGAGASGVGLSGFGNGTTGSSLLSTGMTIGAGRAVTGSAAASAVSALAGGTGLSGNDLVDANRGLNSPSGSSSNLNNGLAGSRSGLTGSHSGTAGFNSDVTSFGAATTVLSGTSTAHNSSGSSSSSKTPSGKSSNSSSR